MNFFFDRCMSQRLCRMVAALEAGAHQVTHHDLDPRFTQTTPDIVWITELSRAALRPVVITGDVRILKRPDEVAALKASGLTFFFLADQWSKFSIYEMAWKFLKVWPEIIAAAKVKEPTVFEVHGGKSLKVEAYSRTSLVTKR